MIIAAATNRERRQQAERIVTWGLVIPDETLPPGATPIGFVVGPRISDIVRGLW
jgi:hypothetical protein